MPKVSVIIPVYNTEKYLPKCLDSVCNQTLSDIEIICINDCSADNSLGILQKYAEHDSRIKIIDFKENKGAAAARNTGIDTAAGEYIGFVDSDDWIDLDFYEKLYDKAKKNNAEVVRGACNDLFLDGTVLHSELVPTKEKILFCSLYGAGIYYTSFVRDFDINFIEECSWGEDRLFPIKACYYAKNVILENSVSYNYKRNNEATTSTYSNKKFLDGYASAEQIIHFLNAIEISSEEYNKLFKKFFDDLLYLFLRYYKILDMTAKNKFLILYSMNKSTNSVYKKYYSTVCQFLNNNEFEALKENIKKIDNKIQLMNNMLSAVRNSVHS